MERAKVVEVHLSTEVLNGRVVEVNGGGKPCATNHLRQKTGVRLWRMGRARAVKAHNVRGTSVEFVGLRHGSTHPRVVGHIARQCEHLGGRHVRADGVRRGSEVRGGARHNRDPGAALHIINSAALRRGEEPRAQHANENKEQQ